ncbi:TolC family protein [Ramlibacter sp. AW1]|uniref:TolC family protein n=2 Tax=Ramlibacter aurantiacus TaxID=2801330 RepID=A0A936ZQE8_9BURK|nr:TolC family protein [Ramlibacter aurantiacus]
MSQPLPASVVPQAPVGAATPTLGLPAVLQAARDNIQVSIARRLQAAARADVLAADRAPTPVFSAKAGSIDLNNGIGPGSPLGGKRIDKELGFDWTLERGNKRALRVRSAEYVSEAAAWEASEVALQQQLAAVQAFYELLSAQERITQLEALERGASELSTAAQRRQRAGDISQQDAVRTDIEFQRAIAERLAAQAERERASLALAQLSGLAPPLAVRADWPQAGQADTLPSVNPDQRADVRAAQRKVEAARVAVESAQALRRNDVTVGTSLSHYPGTSRALMEVRLAMPLAGILGNYGYEGEIARAHAQLAQAQDELDRTRRLAQGESARLAQDLQAARARAAAFEAEIVPRARRVADLAELAYSRGALPLVDLIDARRTLRAVLLEQLAARTDHARALASWQLRASPAQP